MKPTSKHWYHKSGRPTFGARYTACWRLQSWYMDQTNFAKGRGRRWAEKE